MSASDSLAFELVIEGCQHCGKQLKNGQQDFCCAGCETVFNLIHENGLGEYYSLKEKGYALGSSEPILLTGHERFSSWDEVNHSQTVEFYIEGIHCIACLWLLEKLPVLLPHDVESAQVSLGDSRLKVKLKPEAKISRIGKKIADFGYVPHLITEEGDLTRWSAQENRKRLMDLGIAGALAGNVMLMSVPLYAGVLGEFQHYFEWLSFILSVPVVFYSGRSLFQAVWGGVKARFFPIDAPILLAILTAFGFSVWSLLHEKHTLYFDSLTSLIFLLLSSRYYLARLRQSAFLGAGGLQFFSTRVSAKVGDFESLKDGQEITFDGILRSGELCVDASKFSGEADPVQLKVGDRVYAGTLVFQSSPNARVEVTGVGADTRLAGLLKKIEESQNKRPERALISDEWAKSLIVFILLLAGISLGLFAKVGRFDEGINRVLALLIVTCPCALALATPLVFSLATQSLLKKKILVKNPDVLDAVLHSKTIWFDKTGTLSFGRLKVDQGFEDATPGYLKILSSLTSRSSHPVSRAIYRELQQRDIQNPALSFLDFSEQAGKGIVATTSGPARIRYSLLKADTTQSGGTEVIFRDETNDFEIARISLSDEVRPEVPSVLKQIHDLGYRTGVLSGDHRKSVDRLLGKYSFDEVHADLSPEQKAEKVKNQVMVGDGLNDALALSQAQVGISVQGGIEAAIQSSEVYSMRTGIEGVVDLLTTANKVRSSLRFNFALSTSYNLLGAVLSLTGHMSPLLAAILMPMSATTVFTATLWRFRDRKDSSCTS